jgi:hypothetical protein
MPKKIKAQGTAQRRTKVKNLPAKEKKLSKGEQKNVKGGLIGLLKPDQTTQTSNSQITDGTSNAALLPAVYPTDQKR